MKIVQEFSGEQNSAEWTNSRQNGKTERARKLGRKTREEIGRWNPMMALRFQTKQRHKSVSETTNHRTDTWITIENYKLQNWQMNHHWKLQITELTHESPLKTTNRRTDTQITIENYKSQNWHMNHHWKLQITELTQKSPLKTTNHRTDTWITTENYKSQNWHKSHHWKLQITELTHESPFETTNHSKLWNRHMNHHKNIQSNPNLQHYKGKVGSERKVGLETKLCSQAAGCPISIVLLVTFKPNHNQRPKIIIIKMKTYFGCFEF